MFGWTLAQIDEEDVSRLYQAMGAMNIVASYSRVLEAVSHQRLEALTQGDWEIYQLVAKARKAGELDG